MGKRKRQTRFSDNPLAKKYRCDQCGRWFRTLQGLSGHVRFKHGVREEEDLQELAKIPLKEPLTEAYLRGLGESREIIEEMKALHRKWLRLKILAPALGIRLGESDFRTWAIPNIERILDKHR